MRPISRYTLGIMAVVHASAILTTVAARLQGQGAPAAQGAGLTACSIIDAAELKRLTGLKDLLGRGPVLSDPSETPKGVTECEFLGLGFSLTSSISAEGFDATRKSQVKSGTKIEPVAGVGDEAYWGPQRVLWQNRHNRMLDGGLPHLTGPIWKFCHTHRQHSPQHEPEPFRTAGGVTSS